MDWRHATPYLFLLLAVMFTYTGAYLTSLKDSPSTEELKSSLTSLGDFGQVLDRVRRGFRSGASDRFSHGFGKRSEQLYIDRIINDPDWYVSAEDIAKIMANNPKLCLLFIEKYMDTNSDGLISKEEVLTDSP